jgi:L-aspartate oxidase
VQVNIQDVTYSLKSLMWRQMGIERSAEQIEDAGAKIRLWIRAVAELGAPDPATWELVNMLTVAQLASSCALVRAESRGVHYRADHPAPDPAWRAHTRCRPLFGDGRIPEVSVERVPVEDEVATAASSRTA